MIRTLTAEFLGRFGPVLGGGGSAVIAAAFSQLGIGLRGVALAFGLTGVTMADAAGHIPGGHFDPDVTLGLVAAGKPGFDRVASGVAANGHAAHSPGG